MLVQADGDEFAAAPLPVVENGARVEVVLERVGARANRNVVPFAAIRAEEGLRARLLALFETSIAKRRVFRVSEFLATAMLLGLLAVIFLFVTKGL